MVLNNIFFLTSTGHPIYREKKPFFSAPNRSSCLCLCKTNKETLIYSATVASHLPISVSGLLFNGATLFSMMPNDSTGGNGHKLKKKTFHHNMGKNIEGAEHWNRLPSDIMESLFLGVIQNQPGHPV